MPFQINRPPSLVNRFLSIIGGNGPSQLADAVVPTLDMRDMYGGPLLIGSGGAPTVGALTAGLQETVNLGTTLGVRAISAQLVIGAAAATNVHIAVGCLFSATSQEICFGSIFIAQANAGVNLQFGVPLRMVWPAGSVFYSRACGTAAGADHSLSATALLENTTNL